MAILGAKKTARKPAAKKSTAVKTSTKKNVSRKASPKAKSVKPRQGKKHPIHKRILMRITQRGATRIKIMPVLFIVAFAGIGVYFLIRSQAASGDYAYTTCKKDSSYGNCLDNSAHAKVTRVYLAALNRQPDDSGFKYWVDQLTTKGTHIQVVADSFINSNEFKSRYPNDTNRNYVTRLYQNVLGRQPDTDGLNYWTSQLDQKKLTKPQLLIQFTESKENIGLQASKIRCFVAASCTTGHLYLTGKASGTGTNNTPTYSYIISSQDRKLTKEIWAIGFEPNNLRWGPNGISLFYIPTFRESQTSQYRYSGNLYSMNTDGTNPKQLTRVDTSKYNLYAFEISPDGKKIAYYLQALGGRDVDGLQGVWVMDSSIQNPKKLNIPLYRAFSWKDNSTLTYGESKKENDVWVNKLYTYNISSGATGMIADVPVRPGLIDWTPDGRKAVFTAESAEDNNDVYTVNGDGSGLTKISNCTTLTTQVAWGYDNLSVLVSDDKDIYACKNNSSTKYLEDSPSYQLRSNLLDLR